MNVPTVKTHLAIAITTAISVACLSACGTTGKDDKADEITTAAEPESKPLTKPLAQLPIKEQKLHNSKIKQNNRMKIGKKRALSDQYLMPAMAIARESVEVDRENYAPIKENSIHQALESPVSTFSIDVDTGSYTNVRRILNQGNLPRKDAVRAEEFINYFNYDYETPGDDTTPFAVHSEMMASPWSEDSYLLQLGIKAWEPPHQQRPDANLVFLVDVSGSMNSADKLGLLKKSLALLTRKLSTKDRISIVVYAGASGVVLEPVAGNQTAKIELALQRLQAGGSTNGAAGIKLAYQMAEQSFIKGGINRILLATDGDFNVGTTNFDALIDLIEEKRKSGIALSTLGFGSGNYNDHLMEQLADKGNGQYSYIDSLLEARKVLVDEMNSSLLTVAGDVKIQLEFNPNVVTEYRLIGYENRTLAREDFNNDKVDAGEIGAGHTVTALYEVRFTDSNNKSVDPLRYQLENDARNITVYENEGNNELGFLKLRYKKPGEDKSRLIKKVLQKKQLMTQTKQPSEAIKFAASVAAFAQQLGGGKYLGDFGYQQITQLAQESKGKDPRGLRGEFLQLVSLAELLSQQTITTNTGGE
ncbi:MAG: VWA domain-containing protein [Gammaproteobacteria bacterium]|nr:VWA domain-containing protein [Gammaproteobacteria bacterium]